MPSIEDRLQALHDEYAAAVNVAVSEDRAELVAQLADEYADAALELITADAR